MSKVIYTAIFGNYEELKEPAVITPGWKYVCYADQPLTSHTWEIVPCMVEDPVKAARYHKILRIPKGESIWIDASFRINCDLNEFWNKYFTHPFTVVQHPIRNCYYTEATACIKNKRGEDYNIRSQADYYRSLKMPLNKGLIQSGILLRDSTEEVREFCQLWFDQIELSTRDQIGFAYAEWKLDKYWPRIKIDYRDNPYFKFITHFNRRKCTRTQN